ncbi:MAG: PIG-L family deacetylase [Burkholderiaceae bacterium]|jgi:LmbE family N-acetylglucosaminyl deacetylase|nr:PIG-L family deacetylase [Burkholderiaceae bacterium]
MLGLHLPEATRRILCIGAHCDDVEIGCGATLTALTRARPDLHVTVAVFAAEDDRGAESERALAALLGPSSRWQLDFGTFRNSYFPAQWAQIKQHMEGLRSRATPDLILTHRRDDLHQDHRVLGELTWNAFRNHPILEYEIPKYDGDLGHPNLFVPVSESLVEHKIDALMRSFDSQLSKPWFSADTFRGLMRLRGIECQSPSGYAEAFTSRKTVLVV